MLSREQILRSVWGYDYDPGTNVVDVYVGYLRRKLRRPGEKDPIVTVRSVGYRFDAPCRAIAVAERSPPLGRRWLTAWPPLAADLVAAAMILSVAVIFYVVYSHTGTELRSQIDRDIRGDTTQLRQAEFLRRTPDRGRDVIAVVLPRYVRAQPYNATSTLLFVLVPGARAAFNHPEIVGSAQPDEDETPAQQATEDAEARLLLVPHLGYSTQPGPRRRGDAGARAGGHRRRPARRRRGRRAAGGRSIRAQDGVARTFVLAGALTLVLALIASYLAGARVSAPLRRMASVATRVDAGELEPRMETCRPSGPARSRCSPTRSTTCSTA